MQGIANEMKRASNIFIFYVTGDSGSWAGPKKSMSGLGDAKYYGSSGRDLANCELPLQSQGADALGPEPA